MASEDDMTRPKRLTGRSWAGGDAVMRRLVEALKRELSEAHDAETKKWLRQLGLGKSDSAKVAKIEAEWEPDTSSGATMKAAKVRASGWNLTLAPGFVTDEGRETSYANDLDELKMLIQDATEG